VGAPLTLLTVERLRLLRGERVVVDDVSFDIGAGGVFTLTGASGAGKSTLLRAIAGLEPVAAGRITMGDIVLGPGPRPAALRRALCRHVGIVFQFHCLFAHLTALRNVSVAPEHVLGLSRDDAEVHARGWLARLGVGQCAEALPHTLSGGEAQRVAIARAMAMGPSLLLMDEPTASLDPARREELAGTLGELMDDGHAVLVATHDLDFARRLGGRAVTLEGGRLVKRAASGEVS
jgi:polar amino acid transport system ATP-binding protein